ncbi:unnamed protein product [Phytophthora lilii]|uniref:Unnamed protein product n=1 Tax=Phytophthora lilii TaxID=2077276 RepID=A0A9W6YJK1_9STRA|nr:unnamed protein product [Phytophthora lilii]
MLASVESSFESSGKVDSGAERTSLLGMEWSSSSNDECSNASSSSSQSGEPEEVEVDAVTAHGRKWVRRDAVLIDQASHARPRKTHFLWPSQLQLGERTVAKYFYLMYPMQTVNTMLRLTNENLSTHGHRCIGQGDWFRWIGIRLAMALEPRRGPSRVYWKTTVKEGCVGTAADTESAFT